MDNKTSLVILERVKAAREKQAEGPVPGETVTTTPRTVKNFDVTGKDVLGLGIGGAMKGMYPGALLGLGYGAAKGRPGVGTARGIGRGALTVGGAGAGMGIGGMAAQAAGGGPGQQMLGMLLGAGAGGIGGWKVADKVMGKKMKEKEARDPTGEAFAGAVQDMAAGQLRSDAFKDVRNVGLTALGVGAAGRGLVGLVQMMKNNNKKKTRSGPAYLPLPYPAEAKMAGFMDGDGASTKSGIPWYGPAMLGGGLAGLGLGWKGMDKILDGRRQREQKQEVDAARQQFHDALLNQYDEPVKVDPKALGKAAADATMVKVGQALDELYVAFEAAKEAVEKQAVDWSNVGGQAAGGYGMYAGLSGLLTGALVYDKVNKRSRRAVLEKALQKRQRRKFMQSPTEIYAVPEAVETAAVQ